MATVPNPYVAPANPNTYYAVRPTKDPLGFLYSDGTSLTPLAKCGAALYNHCGGADGKGFVHDGLIGYLRGGAFGEGVNHAKYDHSSSVTLHETTPMNIMALPPRILFGATNTHDGYLSEHNDLSIVFPVVIFDNHRQKVVMQENYYKSQVLPQATLRSLVPSLKHQERSCEFHLQEVGGAIDVTVESIAHGKEQLVKGETLRRVKQLELSFTHTLNAHMAAAVATAPSLFCRWARQWVGEAKDVFNGTHPNPAAFIDKLLTQQLASFCPSQLRGVSKRKPIHDLVNSLAFTSSEDDNRPIFLATTSTVAEMLIENNNTVEIPESQRIFYYEENGKRLVGEYRPLQTYPGVGARKKCILPAIQVEGRKLPILKMPDNYDEQGNNKSSFLNYVRGMFAVPIGYTIPNLPPVSTFNDVDFNTVRVTVFDQGGEDGEFQWYRDIIGRSGLNDPALFDPHEYDKMMLLLDGGEAAARAFQSCFKGQTAYDEKVFSPAGITPSDPEFNLCVSNHVLYVGKSFGKTIPENSTYPGLDPNSKFRLTGIDGNRPLCTATGYLQAARSALANMLNMNTDAEKVFAPYLEACLCIPFDSHETTKVKDKEDTKDINVLRWLATIKNLETYVLDQLRGDLRAMDLHLVHILKSVFQGGGVSKWMNVPRVLFALLEAANLGAFVPSLHPEMEGILGVGEMLDKAKYQETVEKLRDVHSKIYSFCTSAMASNSDNYKNVNEYIFQQLPTVVPVVNLPDEHEPSIAACDRDVSAKKLWMKRMFLETVMNLLATHLYAFTDIPEEEGKGPKLGTEFWFQVQVHAKQKRNEKYTQPYFIAGFYTTHEYDARSREELKLEDVTPLHPLLSGKPSAEVAEARASNFYHSHVSRHFLDLRRMYGIPLHERTVTALMCLKPHTPSNALAVDPRVQTHTAAQIIRSGTFVTHRLVAIRAGDHENMFNGFIACGPPVLTQKRTSSGGTALNAFMQTAPVLPHKQNTTIQIPHYFCKGCISGMGHRMANIQGCLDGKVKLPSGVFENEAFAIPVPSCFTDNQFDVPFFPIDGVFGKSFLKDNTLCNQTDAMHTLEGGYSYNPMTRSNAPSEILVLNRRLMEKTAGRLQLPPWSTTKNHSPSRFDLRQRLVKVATAAKEGMKPDEKWQPSTADNYLNITPEDRMCMFERFYHPGPRGHEYGKKSRSILGENSNSSLNWTQTLETHHRLLNQPICPLEQNGRERLINDTPRMNGFVY